MSATSPRASVVIPNWNGMSHLPECLAALDAQTFRAFETIVVDNASTDQSRAWLRANAPGVRLIERQDNGGFSMAVNAGIAAAAGEYVVLLNNDTRADPGWLEALVVALDAHPAYDFAASLMVLYADPDTVNAAGDYYDIVGMVGKNRGILEPVEAFLQPVRVLGACAGAAAYRAGFFEDVGLFDEGFFLTSEDTDINLRALIAGKKCLYVPGARVLHKLRASIDTRPSEQMLRLSERNAAIVFAKCMPVPVLAVAPLLWLYTQLRTTVLVRPRYWRRSPQLLRDLPGRLRAQREGWRIGRQARRAVWSRKAAGTFTILRWLLRPTGAVGGNAETS